MTDTHNFTVEELLEILETNHVAYKKLLSQRSELEEEVDELTLDNERLQRLLADYEQYSETLEKERDYWQRLAQANT
jgi:molecular chaperone GrpE (heat shock protein)